MSVENYIASYLKALKPYSSARDDFAGKARVYLDANENPYGDLLNRYPDPRCTALRERISKIKNVPAEGIFLGNGSDEAIDLVIRLFCEAVQDSIIITPPTYGMYAVQAAINNVKVITSYLTESFAIDVEDILAKQPAKIVFLCSPNNPTGNCLSADSLRELLEKFNGIVVVDEAYIDFSATRSVLSWIEEYENLIVLQTFSKAWGLAGLRLGMAFSQARTIEYLNRIKPPYNVNLLTQNEAFERVALIDQVNLNVEKIVTERIRLEQELPKLEIVKKVFPSDANFLLVKFNDPQAVHGYLISKGIVVRDRSKEPLCEGCLRITVGTVDENNKFLKAIKELLI